MPDPLVERVASMLTDPSLRRIGFRYRGQVVSGAAMAELAGRLVSVKVAAGTGLHPAPGRFGILVNPSHPDLRALGATAFYEAEERVLVVRHAMVQREPWDIIHECWHASCGLSQRGLSQRGLSQRGLTQRGLPYFDEEAIAFIWGAIAEYVFTPCAEPAVVRLRPTDCRSAATPFGRILCEYQGGEPVDITRHPRMLVLEGFVRRDYAAQAAQEAAQEAAQRDEASRDGAGGGW